MSLYLLIGAMAITIGELEPWWIIGAMAITISELEPWWIIGAMAIKIGELEPWWIVRADFNLLPYCIMYQENREK